MVSDTVTKGSPTENHSSKDFDIGRFSVKDERGIAMKVYNVAVVVMDILVLLFQMGMVYAESLYRLIIPREEKDVKGEIILITGSGHGIGRELSLQYSALGSTVVCVDINSEGNAETLKMVKSQGGKAHAYTCDVSNREAVFGLASKIQKEVGEVSVLVNNAGIMPCHSFLTHTESEIKKLYEINVYAHFWMLQAFIPSMINRNHGHIVALSSMAGAMGLTNLVPYCGTKYAVRGIMESLYEELREDIRKININFTTIFPYIVDTGLCKKPRIRFPSMMSIVSPKEAAKNIITAMRRDMVEVSIPSSLIKINNICRALPVKIGMHLKDFLDSGVESHN